MARTNSQLEFMQKLTMLNSTSIAGIFVRTREADRAREIIQEWANDTNLTYLTWDCVRGIAKYPELPVSDGGEIIDLSEDTDYLKPKGIVKGTAIFDKGFDYFSSAETTADDGGRSKVIAFEFAHVPLKVPTAQQRVRTFVEDMRHEAHRAIFIVPPHADVPEDISDYVEIIDLKTPTYDELLEMYTDIIETNMTDADLLPKFSPEDNKSIVSNGAGMTANEFDIAISTACSKIIDMAESDKKFKAKNIKPRMFYDEIMSRKVEVVKSTNLLELMPEGNIEEIGGLDLLKEYLDDTSETFMNPEAAAYGIDKAKGFLCVGPPGTGKSAIAKATSAVFGIPLIKFDLGKVFGKFVGQSEGNMRAALDMVEAMAPCVLFMDEIDKTLGTSTGSSDGGTSGRVFGSLLTWMNDNESDVLVVAAANNPELLPPELVRKGRFDVIWSVNLPNLTERSAILDIHAKKRGHELSDKYLAAISKETTGFSGAELEDIVKSALKRDFKEGNKTITLDTLRSVVKKSPPLSSSYSDKVETQQAWAKKHAEAASTKEGSETTVTPSVKSRKKGGRRLASKRRTSSN